MTLQASCSRRDALAMTAIGLTAAQTRAVAAGTSLADRPAWIDSHAHIWTQDFKRYPLGQSVSPDELNPPNFTADALLEAGRQIGVTRFVLIQHRPIYGFDNSLVLDAAEQHPESFRVVGEINEDQPNVEHVMREMARKRVSGFRITLLTRRQKWIDSRGMNAMWRAATDLGQAICPLTDTTYLDSINRMCGKYPDATVVIDHFARIGVDGTIQRRDVDALCRLATHRHANVKLSAFYGLGKKQPPYDDMIPMIKQLVGEFGPARLMWGSDIPYQAQGGHSYRESLQVIRERIDDFSEDDKAQLLQKTAERVFFADLNV